MYESIAQSGPQRDNVTYRKVERYWSQEKIGKTETNSTLASIRKEPI